MAGLAATAVSSVLFAAAPRPAAPLGVPPPPPAPPPPVFVPPPEFLPPATPGVDATAAAPSTAAATQAAPGPVVMRPGERLAAEDLLAALAFRTGILIVKADSIKGDVTVTQEFPEDPVKAIAALNEMLAPLGYSGVPVKGGTSNRLVLRVVSAAEARRQALETGPVTLGTDPRKIDVSERERMVTHIVPLGNAELLAPSRKAVAEVKDIEVTVAGAADQGFRMILTGPALSVRRAVESIVALDPQAAAANANVFRSIQLKHLEAEGSAAVLNGQFGRDAEGKQVIQALADKRTNSIIVSGSEVEVFRAIQLLQRMDAAAESAPRAAPPVAVPPAQTVPPGPAPTPANPGAAPGGPGG